LEHCERPFSCQVATQKSLSGMNDEQCRPVTLTLCLAKVSSESIATLNASSVDSTKGCVASWFPQNNSQVAITAGTTSGEVSSHCLDYKPYVDDLLSSALMSISQRKKALPLLNT
jgi:hypothetical protein